MDRIDEYRQIAIEFLEDFAKNDDTALSSNMKHIHLESEGRGAGRGERLYFTIEESAVMLS